MALSKLVRVRVPAASSPATVSKASSLEEFGSEEGRSADTGHTGSGAASPTPAIARWRTTAVALLARALAAATNPPAGRWRTTAVALLALALAAGAGAAAYWKLRMVPARAAAAQGSLTINSDPSGLQIMSGGVTRGKTPLTLSLPAGEHAFELVRTPSERQPLRATVAAGSTVVHHVKFEVAAAAAPTTGTLMVATEPARLRVLVDGVLRGAAPISLADLPPGSHRVDVQSPTGVLTRTVDIVAGQTASVFVTANAAAPPTQAAGWLTVSSPVPVQLFEGGELIGTSDTARLMLPAGKHVIALANQSLGFTDSKTVQVSAGGTTALKVDVPRVPLSLNALPWAQAWIDGASVGETPIGNHLVPIGSHEIVFRHPELGERRQTVLVTLSSPARVSLDMRKK